MSPCSCAATTATSQVTASTKQRFLALSNLDRRLCYVLNITYTKQMSSLFFKKIKKKLVALVFDLICQSYTNELDYLLNL